MPQSDDLHTLHDEKNNALVRLLFERVSTMRGGSGHISEAIEKSAGNAPVPTNASGVADARSDIGGSEGGGPIA